MGDTDEPLPVKRCPKARARSGKRHASKQKPHDPHTWWAGQYMPVGDLGYWATCPGFRPEIVTTRWDTTLTNVLRPPKGTEKKMAKEGFHLGIESGVSVFTGEPFCAVFANHERVGQLTPTEVRALALQWLAAAESAESDAAVVAELRTMVDEDTAVSFLVALRERRTPPSAH